MNPWTFTLALYKDCPNCKQFGPPYAKIKWFPWDTHTEIEQASDFWTKPREGIVSCDQCGKTYQARLSL